MGFLTFLGSFIGGFFGVGGSFLSEEDFALLLNNCLDRAVSIFCITHLFLTVLIKPTICIEKYGHMQSRSQKMI
jgi:uncharacterized membrane protein YfcA